jgi:hypothetical protein
MAREYALSRLPIPFEIVGQHPPAHRARDRVVLFQTWAFLLTGTLGARRGSLRGVASLFLAFAGTGSLPSSH